MADKWHSCCLLEYSAGRHVAQSLDGCFWHFATSLCDFFIFLFLCISLFHVLCTRCCTAAKIKPKWKLQNKKKLRNKVVNGQDAEKLGEKNVSMENNPNTMRIAARCQLTRLMFFYSSILGLRPVTVVKVSCFLFHFWHLRIQQLLYKNGLFQTHDLQI